MSELKSRHYIITVNECLEIPMVIRNDGKYSLVELLSENCTLPTNNLRRIKIEDIEFLYANSFDSNECVWMYFKEAEKLLADSYQKRIIMCLETHITEVSDNPQIIDSLKFVHALEDNDLEKIRKIPKSDLHNHAPLGGSRKILYQLTGYMLPELKERFDSILDMNAWCKSNLKGKLGVTNEYVTRVLATFMQAKNDGVTVFAPNFAICASKDFNHSFGDLLNFISTITRQFSDGMAIYPELCLDRNKYVTETEENATYLLESGLFSSIDMTGDEFLGVEKFCNIYARAKKLGIIRKAHVGEFAPSDFVSDAISKLDLNTVQHGLSAVYDDELLTTLKKDRISLTICPTSNYVLSRVNDVKNHPIKQFYKKGISVTVCSDDILIFNSSVSEEYLKLHNNKVLSAFELNSIRVFGLHYYGK